MGETTRVYDFGFLEDGDTKHTLAVVPKLGKGVLNTLESVPTLTHADGAIFHVPVDVIKVAPDYMEPFMVTLRSAQASALDVRNLQP